MHDKEIEDGDESKICGEKLERHGEEVGKRGNEVESCVEVFEVPLNQGRC